MTNLISFYDWVTRLVDKGKAVGVVYLDFSKAIDIVSHSILLGKMAACVLNTYTLCWVRNWLEGHAQWVVVNEVSQAQPVFHEPMLAGPDPLDAMHMLCDLTQDDLRPSFPGGRAVCGP